MVFRNAIRAMLSRTFAAGCAAALIVGSSALVSCAKQDTGDAAKKSMKARPVPVTVGLVRTKSVPLQITGLFGWVDPNASVTVKPEVTGMLVKVCIEKGQSVKKGDLLYEIDPRPFDAAVAQAEASLSQAQAAVMQAQAAVGQAQGALVRDQVQEANARRDVARLDELIKKGAGARQDYDHAVASADAYKAAVQSDEAAVKAVEATVVADKALVRVSEASLLNAKLQREHCTLRSLIDGKAGNLLVDEGNVVMAATTALVTINQISPIDVFFSVQQRDLPTVKKYLAQGSVRVRALFPQEEGGPEEGKVTFVDNTMDRVSLMIQLGATFENKSGRLWPGQYVNVELGLAVDDNAVVVPTRAVQTGRDNKYVYVVEDDNSVQVRPVVVSDYSGDDAVVKGELAVGERVVTDGQFQLTRDSKVAVRANGSGKSGPGAAEPGKKNAPVAGAKRSSP